MDSSMDFAWIPNIQFLKSLHHLNGLISALKKNYKEASPMSSSFYISIHNHIYEHPFLWCNFISFDILTLLLG